MLGEHLLPEQAVAHSRSRPWRRSLFKGGLGLAVLAAVVYFMKKPTDSMQKEMRRSVSEAAHEPMVYFMKKATDVMQEEIVRKPSDVRQKENTELTQVSETADDIMCVNDWKASPHCAPTFEYHGVTLHGCTTAGNKGVGWCSTDPIYRGNHVTCTSCNEDCADGSCKADCLESWDPLPNCAPNFTYAGHTYYGCTSVGNNGQGWCSYESVYSGKWGNCARRSKPCRDACTNGFQLHSECAPTYTYQGVLYKGCTDTNSKQFWCSTSTVYSGDYRWCDAPCEISACLNGWKPSKSCASQWKHKGQTHRGCASIAQAGVEQGWCSWDAEFVEDSGRYSMCEPCEQKAPVRNDSSNVDQALSYLPGFNFIAQPRSSFELDFVLPTTVQSANELFHHLPVQDATRMHKSIRGEHIEALYDDFLQTFGSIAHGGRSPRRSFDTPEEYRYRLEVFLLNILVVLKKNAKAQVTSSRPDHARYGITIFADWTQKEFLSSLKTSPPSLPNRTLPPKDTPRSECSTAGGPAGVGTPCVFPFVYNGVRFTSCTTVNNNGQRWCATEVGANSAYIGNKWGTCSSECAKKPLPCGGVVKVAARQQGSCGSCWAYSTVETIRQNHFWSNNWLDPGPLSADYLIKCDSKDSGCDGGMPAKAMTFIGDKGGIPSFAQYAASQQCSLQKSLKMSGPTHWFRSEEEMAENFCERGGISVAVDGTELQHYSHGVIDHAGCAAHSSHYINHAVVIAGLDATIGAWIARNSWGLDYGVSPTSPYPKGGGHILMAYGEDTCNIRYWPIAADKTALM